MLNNRIKHLFDKSETTSTDPVGLAELEAFVNAVEDMVCEAVGEGLLEGKLFGINVVINPVNRECRIWRCDVGD